MSTALATQQQLTPDTWTMIQAIAPTIKDSKLFGVTNAEQAASIMLKGYELGFGLTASFEFIAVIDSKPTLSPRGMLALILNSPLCTGVEIKDEADEAGAAVACSVTMKRRGGLTYTARFTMEDARRAGLIKDRGAWEKYPANMLRWRAIGYCADVVFPDLLNGMKRADELGAEITPEGEVIEGSWAVDSVPEVEPEPAPLDLTIRIGELIERYGTQAILDANGGQIPASMTEMDNIVAALNEEGKS